MRKIQRKMEKQEKQERINTKQDKLVDTERPCKLYQIIPFMKYLLKFSKNNKLHIKNNIYSDQS